MGGVVEVLAVAVGSGGACTALVRSLSAWAAHRRSDVSLTLRGDNGQTLKVDAKRVDSTALVRELKLLLDTSEDSE